MKAIWNGQVIAESDDTIVVEHNHYFPHTSIKQEFFRESKTKTRCYWKGEASYYTLVVDGKVNIDGAWFYPETTKEALSIKNRVAFWHGVEVTE